MVVVVVIFISTCYSIGFFAVHNVVNLSLKCPKICSFLVSLANYFTVGGLINIEIGNILNSHHFFLP